MWLALEALFLSWLINKFLLERIGEYAIYLGAPVIEEFLKSIPAYLLDRPILPVHFWFGIGEALYDICTGRGDRVSGRFAALASIISHSLFGGAAYLLMEWTASIAAALIVSVILHMGWNYGVMRMGKVERN